MIFQHFVSGLSRVAKLGIEIAKLPRATLEFNPDLHLSHIRATHASFTKRHPRYRVIRNKTIGIALMDLRRFNTAADYLDTVKKKDYAGYHAKRAKARGYRVSRIDRNEHADAIHEINISAECRQGRPMDDAYRVKEASFEDYPHFAYFGIQDEAGKLMGYCNVATLGNFAATDRILGYKNGDGFMHLLVTEIVCRLIEEKNVSYLMYDTYLGAQPGLRSFKRKLGFSPYRVRYGMP
ncbi:MAG: hypothetical protein ACXWVG_03065 [Telluria sp.]